MRLGGCAGAKPPPEALGAPGGLAASHIQKGSRRGFPSWAQPPVSPPTPAASRPGNLPAVLEPRAAAVVLQETDVRGPVNKAGEGGDWVTPVKYHKINTRTVGILQVN